MKYLVTSFERLAMKIRNRKHSDEKGYLTNKLYTYTK